MTHGRPIKPQARHRRPGRAAWWFLFRPSQHIHGTPVLQLLAQLAPGRVRGQARPIPLEAIA